MRYRLLIVAGLPIITVIVGFWYWYSRPTQSPPPSNKQTTSSANLDDTFLTIDRAPAINLQTTLANSFVIPAGTNMNRVVTIATTGDIIPARGVDAQIRAHGSDYPFAGNGITDLLSQADLAIVDLESPLIVQCPVTLDGFTFCGQPSFAASMAKAGIDVATLENNHISNYGAAGVEETIQHLTAVGMRYASDTHLDIETVKGLKIGILAFSGIGGRFYSDDVTKKITEARPQVDVLMVAFHWGKEYELVPTIDPVTAPDNPRTVGRLAIDAGADIVVGNHPHWVQGVELYKGKPISYALGNFIFDQSWSLPTEQGVVTSYTFYGSKLIGMSLTAIHIDNQAQPKVVNGAERDQILNQFRQSSMLMATSSATRRE
jgi:hypothetical protein